ncbi:topoisomerase DNA-binding C4 zinc finger domain-containing protein [Myxococcota bacterium]
MSEKNTTNTNATTNNNQEGNGRICPKCGSDLILRNGKRGPFYGCTGFPQCRFATDADVSEKAQNDDAEMPCPACGAPMQSRSGFRGDFWRCTECKKTLDAQALFDARGVMCSECSAPMVVRNGKRGKFLGCSRFPTCRQTSPLPEEEAANGTSAAANAATNAA